MSKLYEHMMSLVSSDPLLYEHLRKPVHGLMPFETLQPKPSDVVTYPVTICKVIHPRIVRALLTTLPCKVVQAFIFVVD